MAPLRRAATAAEVLLALTGLLLLVLSPAGAATAAVEGGELRMKQSDGGYSYNSTLAHVLVEYASAVYTSDLTSLLTWTCPRCEGHTKGFEMIEIIVDIEKCLQAFVGVAPDPQSIIIAFRGTQEHSASNWIEDLFWKQLDVTYPGMPNAMVHHGFYSAYYNTTLRHEILKSVQWAWKIYGRLPINVVGHSMGGALASFCALDLSVKWGSHKVQLITFGQPRVGNPAFAEYFNEQVWLRETIVGNVVTRNATVCDCSGEDPICSRSVYGRSVADHLEYYGVNLHADSRGTCQFVIGASNSAYGDILQVDGTIILSRYLQERYPVESI
ncbi:lipase-like isoform X2 [Hordeum vulgare subsp. vulgare]|uniref:lipase-like isoform X2 n=1 Tax=Hordeum vulgare subsp. vulgare TaxID=112509 RepID=UPI001D1A444B|nr:lipase-like isoform X2 [Hordeum vulgare subsp. vulgare]